MPFYAEVIIIKMCNVTINLKVLIALNGSPTFYPVYIRCWLNPRPSSETACQGNIMPTLGRRIVFAEYQ